MTWPDRAWLALLAGTVPTERLAAMRLIVTPGTILRWQRDIVRRRWARLSRREPVRAPGNASQGAVGGAAAGPGERVVGIVRREALRCILGAAGRNSEGGFWVA